MIANRRTLLCLAIGLFVMTGCIVSTPTTIPAIQNKPTFDITAEIPASLTQPDNQSQEELEELIVQIASSEIIRQRPFLIAVSEVSKRNLWQGVSPKIKDMEKCWIVEIDVVKQCENEDIRNFLGNPNALKIFFASAYSDSLRELFILDYYHPPAPYDMSEKDMQDIIDGYRLVIEIQDGQWMKKSLTQVY
jgi:hypothetical protein